MRSLYPTPEDKAVAAMDAKQHIDQHYQIKEQQRCGISHSLTYTSIEPMACWTGPHCHALLCPFGTSCYHVISSMHRRLEQERERAWTAAGDRPPAGLPPLAAQDGRAPWASSAYTTFNSRAEEVRGDGSRWTLQFLKYLVGRLRAPQGDPSIRLKFGPNRPSNLNRSWPVARWRRALLRRTSSRSTRRLSRSCISRRTTGGRPASSSRTSPPSGENESLGMSSRGRRCN